MGSRPNLIFKQNAGRSGLRSKSADAKSSRRYTRPTPKKTNLRIHRMTLDTESLSAGDRLDAIVKASDVHIC